MQKIANEYENKNRGKGRVTKVTDYCFFWETLHDKNGNVKETVFMKSYFM